MTYTRDRKLRKTQRDAQKQRQVFKPTEKSVTAKDELLVLGDKGRTTIVVTGYTEEAKAEIKERYEGILGLNNQKKHLAHMDNNHIFR